MRIFYLVSTFIVSCLLIVLAGCAPSAYKAKKEAMKEKPKPVELFEEKEETPSPPITGEAPSSKPAEVLGYRVQIFATTSQESADRLAEEARAKLIEGVYIEYLPPFYKVRVGDCLTQQEAQNLKERIINAGFQDAFVVETKIKTQ